MLRFLIMSLAFYAMSTFEGPVMSIKTVNALALYRLDRWACSFRCAGWVAMVGIGAIYHMMTKVFHVQLWSTKLVNAHF